MKIKLWVKILLACMVLALILTIIIKIGREDEEAIKKCMEDGYSRRTCERWTLGG